MIGSMAKAKKDWEQKQLEEVIFLNQAKKEAKK